MPTTENPSSILGVPVDWRPDAFRWISKAQVNGDPNNPPREFYLFQNKEEKEFAVRVEAGTVEIHYESQGELLSELAISGSEHTLSGSSAKVVVRAADVKLGFAWGYFGYRTGVPSFQAISSSSNWRYYGKVQWKDGATVIKLNTARSVRVCIDAPYLMQCQLFTDGSTRAATSLIGMPAPLNGEKPNLDNPYCVDLLCRTLTINLTLANGEIPGENAADIMGRYWIASN